MKLIVALAMLPLSAAFLAAPMPRASLAVPRAAFFAIALHSERA